MATISSKAILLYALPPREGHMRPALQITSHLVARGFDITIIGVSAWKDAIISAGARYAPMIGLWDTLDDLTSPKSKWKKILDLAHNPKEMRRQLTAALSHKVLPSGLESVRHALSEIHRRHSSLEGRTVVILSDTCFSGTLPLKLGSDRPPGYENVNIRTIGIGVVPQFWASSSRSPWGVGLAHDPTDEGVERNLKAYADEWDQEAEDRARWMLEALNCDETVDELFLRHDADGLKGGIRHPFHDSYTVCHDTTLQLTLPSLELPARTPEHLKFAGSLPLKPLSLWHDLQYPSWFDSDIREARKNQKRVVVVAQGTESPDFNDLIIPCINGLADRDDIVVVAILCRKGASLGEYEQGHSETTGGSFVLASNAHVIDYFPYDAVLEHADIFVSASGYGGLTHAVANSVPLIQAGRLLDKVDIGRRVEYSGLGIYLEGNVGPKDVCVGVDRILHNYQAYKDRALRLKAESKSYQPLEILEQEILRFTT
ncbi:hypothetical protein N0V93_002097 [Gnomoniopsis smithogilvyi]|uniref:Glycosyltransferase n=1 Tax=Gnomoniopsis smithogilvyi TaxID=1191159 RepID=A0A9W8Z4X9_9PEZI|nr:hypothetical protein N0V93_002097 [Gnomoniopsis smithogilvyi]